MELEEYKKKIQEVLSTPLSTDSPENLYKESALIESMAYIAVRQAALMETKIANLNEILRDEKAKVLPTLSGNQLEKTIKIEALVSSTLKAIDEAETTMKYWKSVGKLIENKISLSQSILANITSQIKANLYLENIK